MSSKCVDINRILTSGIQHEVYAVNVEGGNSVQWPEMIGGKVLGRVGVELGDEVDGGTGAVGGSATVATSVEASLIASTSKVTRRSGDEVMPKTSPRSSSWHYATGIDWQPEETKYSEGSESS